MIFINLASSNFFLLFISDQHLPAFVLSAYFDILMKLKWEGNVVLLKEGMGSWISELIVKDWYAAGGGRNEEKSEMEES